ncbi:MAG: hypothetical protein LC132_11605, partial [Burkholderiales bacterium]|nr:hypothetical protein [Burkholderiales bacterium]
AEVQGWVDKDTARKIFASVVAFTGVDMNFEEIKDNLEKQESSRGYEDYKKGKPDLKVANAD